jgi:hypothetical protein
MYVFFLTYALSLEYYSVTGQSGPNGSRLFRQNLQTPGNVPNGYSWLKAGRFIFVLRREKCK